MAKKKKEIVDDDKENILLDKKIETKEIKEDLTKYIDDKINKVFVFELDKANRKLLREKSKKIIIKNIVILILLAIIGFLVYLLYSNRYFDRFFSNTNQIAHEEEIKKSDSVKEEEVYKDVEKVSEPTLDELKKEYAFILDNYIISDKSLYLNDFYSGNLSSELKNYLVLNSLNFNSLTKNEDYQIIHNDTFKKAYEIMFSDSYEAKSFDFNNNKIRYLEAMESYVTTSLLTKENSLVVREIKDIKKDNDIIVITTIEGIIKENKLYNVLDNNEINDYQGDNILKYEDALNKVVYTFKDNKLISLSK